MATAEQLKALIRSHAAGDDDRFYSVAMQVAARAAQQGHGRYARDLKALVDRSRDNPGTQPPFNVESHRSRIVLVDRSGNRYGDCAKWQEQDEGSNPAMMPIHGLCMTSPCRNRRLPFRHGGCLF
jgi:hypothetical protein